MEKMKILRGNRKSLRGHSCRLLTKTFDNIFHDLLILKLNGFDRNALKLIYGYFSDRSQKPKVGSFFSACLDIIYDLPQGSILESLMSNIDLCDLFF